MVRMIKKRFTIDEEGNITDTKNDRCLYVENKMTECDYFVKLLNAQHEQIQKLEKENEHLKQTLNRNIEVKEFLLEEELELNDTTKKFLNEHYNEERYK